MLKFKLRSVKRLILLLRDITKFFLKKQSYYEAELKITDFLQTDGSIDRRVEKKGFLSRILVDAEIIDSRLSECESCEHLFKPTRNCKLCYCFVDAKTKLKGQSCPAGKWSAVND